MIQTYSEQTDLKVSQATKIRQFSPSRHQHDRNVWVILLMQTLIIIILPQVSLCCWTTLDCAVIKFKYEHSHFTVLCWYPTTSLCLIMKYAALKKSFYYSFNWKPSMKNNDINHFLPVCLSSLYQNIFNSAS